MTLGAILISTAGVWVKIADVPASVSAFYRMSIGGTLLLLISVFYKERLWIDFKYFIKLFLVGFLFALDLYFWHKSIHYIGPGLATVLANFQVFIMSVVGFFIFKEVLKLNFVFGLICSSIGLYLMVGLTWFDVSDQYQIGILLGLATAVAYSGFLLTLRSVESQHKRLSTTANLAIMSLSTAFLLIIIILYENSSFQIPNLKSLYALTALGVFPQVIAWFLISRSMPHLPASITGSILLLQPALSMLWDVLFLNRGITNLELAGLTLILFGVYFSTRNQKK